MELIQYFRNSRIESFFAVHIAFLTMRRASTQAGRVYSDSETSTRMKWWDLVIGQVRLLSTKPGTSGS